VRLQRGGSPAPAAAGVGVAAAVERAPAPLPTETAASSLVTIEAPMVGTFYRASSPTAEPYVHEGDVVKEGQILCIIEAMKLMNEIEAKAAGRIVKICVENAHPVEFGQSLFLIEPAR
jgi:acetyl-CoA carboxylase biotin carboxyl carrier protein